MRVICCPILDRIDIDALASGYRDRPEIIRTSRLDVLARGRQEVLRERTAVTAWLVASGHLDVRIAVREAGYANHIYHEKLGLFGDQEGSWIAFCGSANESLAGLEGNFESVDIFRSWVPEERKRLDQKLRSFENLWANETDGVEVLSFAEAARRGLLKAPGAAAEGRPQSRRSLPQHTAMLAPCRALTKCCCYPSIFTCGTTRYARSDSGLPTTDAVFSTWPPAAARR